MDSGIIIKFIIPSAITSFLVTFFIIPKIIRFSRSTNLFPAKLGDRHEHQGKIPVFGGVGIFAGLMISLFIWRTMVWGDVSMENNYIQEFRTGISIIISLFIVFFTGLVDDLLSLSPIKKLLLQIISILIIILLGDIEIYSMQGVFGIYDLPYRWITILFTIFVVVVITNSYNLIDGIDGLAGGLGVISSSLFGILFILNNDIGFAIFSFSLMGSLLAFLKYNFSPARIFMGDSGSLVVGLILSIFAIRIIDQGVHILYDSHFYVKKGPLAAIVILSIPLFDTFRIFCIRSLSGYNPLSPDRNHIHHVLLDLGLNHKIASFILWISNILIVVFSYFLIDLKPSLSIFLLSVFVLTCMSLPFIILRVRQNK